MTGIVAPDARDQTEIGREKNGDSHRHDDGQPLQEGRLARDPSSQNHLTLVLPFRRKASAFDNAASMGARIGNEINPGSLRLSLGSRYRKPVDSSAIPLWGREVILAHRAVAPEYHAVASEAPAVRVTFLVTLELSIFRESGRLAGFREGSRRGGTCANRARRIACVEMGGRYI